MKILGTIRVHPVSDVPRIDILRPEEIAVAMGMHPPYSPDLTPSDLFLFPKMKEHLAGKRFANDEDLKGCWLNNQAAT